jgi:hypothetical protein
MLGSEYSGRVGAVSVEHAVIAIGRYSCRQNRQKENRIRNDDLSKGDEERKEKRRANIITIVAR